VTGYDGSPDGKSVVYISDKSGTPQLYLQPLPVSTTSPLPPAKPLAKLPGPVAGVSFLPGRTTLRASVYEDDDWFSLYELDMSGKTAPKRLDAPGSESRVSFWSSQRFSPALPDPGSVRFESPRYTSDEKWVMLTGVGDRLGDDLWISSRPSKENPVPVPIQVTKNLPDSLAASCLNDGVIVSIPAPGGKTVPALMYRRETTAKAGLIFLGPGYSAEKLPEYNPLFQYFANRGFVVLVLTVPSWDEGKSGKSRGKDLPSVVESTILPAREWLEKEQQVPEGRTALWGNAEGGTFALMAMAAAPGKFAGTVTVGAPTDLARWIEALPDGDERDWLKKSLGDPRKKSAELKKLSPLYVKNGTDLTPLVILHGRNDKRVPVEQSERLAERLLGETRGFTFHVFDGEGSTFRKRETKIAAYNLVLKFMRRHFLDKPLPVVKKAGMSSAPAKPAPSKPSSVPATKKESAPVVSAPKVQ
jgi:dienelactone hydrolase